jgi:UDP-2,3-diacylglucosamine pyrophosphatase LpxH
VILLFNSQGRRRALSTYFSFLLIPERRKVIRIKLRKKKKKKKIRRQKWKRPKKKKKQAITEEKNKSAKNGLYQ